MKWMRERKWYLKTMAVGFIGSFFLLFLFYRQAALCFLGAVLGSVCYVRYRIKVQKEQEKWQLMVEFKEAMDSMVSALAAGYSDICFAIFFISIAPLSQLYHPVQTPCFHLE